LRYVVAMSIPLETSGQRKSSKASDAPDHRTRTAEVRREQMRRRLIESAIIVFAEHGVNSAVIGQVITAAGVSRGSFYNYFRTNEELSDAVCMELAGELVFHAEAALTEDMLPERALAMGGATVLRCAFHYPVLGRFMSTLSLNGDVLMREMSKRLSDQLEAGMASGAFHRADIGMVTDILISIIRTAILRIALGHTAPLTPDEYIRAVVASMLRALGVPPDAAAGHADVSPPTPVFAETSLIARAQARQDASHPAEEI
jgi:AcrR family transcriptional regulator